MLQNKFFKSYKTKNLQLILKLFYNLLIINAIF